MEDICLDFHPDHMKDVAEEIVMYVIEKKLKDVKKTGELLDFLVTKHALLPSQLENAFYILLDMSPDLIIDIPTLMQNVAMLLSKFSERYWGTSLNNVRCFGVFFDPLPPPCQNFLY